MEKQLKDLQDTNSITSTHRKNKIGLPLIALVLDLLPLFLAYLPGMFGRSLSSFVLLFMVLSPIAGLTTGIVSLCRRKGRMGMAEKIIAIVSVVLPLSLVVFIVVFFIGAVTGIISFM